MKEGTSPDTKIHKLCDLCRNPFQTTYGHYIGQRKVGWELWCDTCTVKRDSTLKTGKCIICGLTFKSSEYWFLMKKADFPDKCCACRLADREIKRQKLDGRKVIDDVTLPYTIDVI